MADIKLRQRRYSSVSGGVPLYHLETVVERASAPDRRDPIDPNVFIFSMGESSVLDKFSRVATIADMDILYSSRDSAEAHSHTEYRSNVVVLTFQDLDTAIAAIPVLRDRVDSLVTVRNKAVDSFLTIGEEFQVPSPAEVVSVKQSYIDEYVAARDARATSDASQAAAQTEYDSAQDTVDSQDRITAAHCAESARAEKIGVLAAEAATTLASCKQAVNSALRASSRLTRVVAKVPLAGWKSQHATEAGVTLDYLAENYALGGTYAPFGVAQDSDERFGTPASTVDYVVFRVEGVYQSDSADGPGSYIPPGSILQVGKTGGGQYTGVVSKVVFTAGVDSGDPGANADNLVNSSKFYCTPSDALLVAEDFYTVNESLVSITETVTETYLVYNPVSQQNEDQTIDKQVPRTVSRRRLSFEEITIRSLTDSLGLDIDGGLTEQAFRQVLASLPVLLNPSTGLLAVAEEGRSMARVLCQNSTLLLEANQAAEQATLDTLNEKKAGTAASSAKEEAALSNLKEYCPTLDVSTV